MLPNRVGAPGQLREDPLRLLLLRHGEAIRRGIEDFGLTDRGRAQAEALAAAVGLEPIGRVLASPSPRAQQTAGLIADELGLAVETSAALCEMGEIPPLGSNTSEGSHEFLERVAEALAELVEDESGEAVAVVCHAGVIVASLIALFDIPRPGTGSRLEPDHCSVTEWECREGRWTLCRFNVLLGEALSR